MRRKNFRKVIQWFAVILAASAGASSSVSAQSLPTENNRRASAFNFAASEKLVTFPVPVGRGTVGLVIIDRQSGQQRLIYEDKAFLLYPHFSSDGKRLIFVRNDAYANENAARTRKLVVCAVDNWHCQVWLDTTATIHSPAEFDENTILFSSSPVDKRPDGKLRYNKHDFYLLSRSSRPEKLTNFGLHELGSISVAGPRFVFMALEAPTNAPILSQARGVIGPGSDIYALDFDHARREIRTPSQPLQPLVLVEGFSTMPAAALDGRIAFLNRRTKAGRTRFSLAISAPDGKLEKYIEASGWAFSRPVFVGNTVLANETFDKHYEVKLFDLANTEAKVVAKLEYNERTIRALERISLTFDQ